MKRIIEGFLKKVRNTFFYLFLPFVIIIFIFIVTSKKMETLDKITSVGVLVSLISIFLVSYQNEKHSRTDTLVKKAQFTNDFINEFRTLMPGLFWCTELSMEVVNSNVKLKQLYESIKNKKLDLTVEGFEKLLSENSLSCSDVINIFNEYYDNPEKLVKFARDKADLEGQNRYNDFDKSYEQYEKESKIINDSIKEFKYYSRYNEDIKTKKAEIKDMQQQLKKLMEDAGEEDEELFNKMEELDKKAEDFIENFNGYEEAFETFKKAKMKYDHIKYSENVRVNEQDLFNDLECVTLSTQFGLIDYEKIVDLIYAPFSHFMNACYIRLMANVVENYRNDDYILYSNIIRLYNNIFDFRSEKMKKLKKIEKEVDIVLKKKKKKILSNKEDNGWKID